MIIAFFLKAHTPPQLPPPLTHQPYPTPLPFWLGHGTPLFSRTGVLSHCAIWPPGSQEELEENWLSQPPGALVGLGNSLSFCPQDYGFMLSLAGISWLKERMPQVTAWYSYRTDCNSQTLGIVFSSVVLRAPVGEAAVSLPTIQACLQTCAIVTVLSLRKMENSTGKKSHCFSFSVTLVRGLQAVSSPDPSPLAKATAGCLVNLAAVPLLPVVRDFSLHCRSLFLDFLTTRF